ncbi:hydroxyacid dehydrogenase, partial [Candidatus Woesearchaeota archaeon CG_4_10_14_0_8_um_filter_47_5]
MATATTIAFFELKPWEKAYLRKKLKKHTLLFFDGPITDANLSFAKKAGIISVFIYSQVSEAVLKKLPKLKVITTRSTGFDHIDLAACKKRGIIVGNVPFYGENTVAEHTFALILSLSRNIHKSYVRTLQDDYSIEGLTGFDLKNKTIGIIGGGHIGMHVAKIAKGFDMSVLVYDVQKNELLAKALGFTYASLEALLRASDIITLHLPLNKHTEHIINADNITLLKKGAILINTARGSLVDTDALYDALKKGRLGGAGLDVIEGEELIKEEGQLLHQEKDNIKDNIEVWRAVVRDHSIFKMDNVVFTPHNAFNSREALVRILDATIENIEA